MTDATDWNTVIATLPGAHFLQTAEWAAVKTGVGWAQLQRKWQDGNGNTTAAASVLERNLTIRGLSSGLRVLYVPRGPLLADWADPALRALVLDDLAGFASQRGAIFIKMDAEVPLGWGVPGSETAREDPTGKAVTASLVSSGWRFSSEQVQFRNTMVLDLTPPEDELLARMKQKARYNIRLAERKGVRVRRAEDADLPALYAMYRETALRDGFVIRPEAYYLGVWRRFMQAAMAEPLVAEVEGEAVAGLVQFRFARRAWYVYGMSRDRYREYMPNHLLQWEAMRRARIAGCLSYDLWGAPDEFHESDPMWGVYRFKEGLGGEVVRSLGAWDYPARPALYILYTRILPRILDVMRRRGKARTRQEVSL